MSDYEIVQADADSQCQDMRALIAEYMQDETEDQRTDQEEEAGCPDEQESLEDGRS